jgi:hypothetical protein
MDPPKKHPLRQRCLRAATYVHDFYGVCRIGA